MEGAHRDVGVKGIVVYGSIVQSSQGKMERWLTM
jgi:hypothetical protein